MKKESISPNKLKDILVSIKDQKEKIIWKIMRFGNDNANDILFPLSYLTGFGISLVSYTNGDISGIFFGGVGMCSSYAIHRRLDK